MYRFLVLAMLLVLGGGGVARAQLVLDEVAARKNLVSETKPVMPKTEARAGGKVMLLVTISKDGRVTAAQADSGPLALRAPAVDAVKKWRFRPFTSHGDKVIVHTKLAVVFGDGAAEAKPRQEEAVVTAPPAAQAVAAGDYAALAAKCHELVRANVDAAAEAKACRVAAAEAGKFAAGTHTVERRSAYIYAATALMRTNDLKAATTFGSRAVAVVKEGHDDNSGSSAAYAVRGQAEAFAGDLASADRDLLIAEDFERRAIAGEAGKPLEPEYRAAMKSLLLFHAQLLKGMKRADDATAKTAEAGQY